MTDAIERGLEELRRKQAMRAMQKVAVLLDVWKHMPNDEGGFLRRRLKMMKQPESPVDVKLHEFGELLDDVVDAAIKRERASTGYYMSADADYREMRDRLMGAIYLALLEVFGEPNEDSSGQRREPMSPHPLDDQQPFFLTQWEREDYERRKRGEPELGPDCY